MNKFTFKGVRITERKVIKFEVRDPTGRVIRTFSSRASALAYINGYIAALKRAGQDPELAEPVKPRVVK